MLNGLQIPMKQKISFVVVFSLSTIIIGIDILRTYFRVHADVANAKNLYVVLVLDKLQVGIAIVVSSLLVYGRLLGISRKYSVSRKASLFTAVNTKRSASTYVLDPDDHMQTLENEITSSGHDFSKSGTGGETLSA